MADSKWEEERKELWEAIFTRIHQQHPTFSPAPNTKLGREVYLTTGEIEILMGLVPSRKCINCNLWITRDKDFYKQLELQRAEIEAELGQSLRWEGRPESKSASVYMEEMIDPKEPANREKVIAWFAANAVPFYNAFRSRIDRLHAPA